MGNDIKVTPSSNDVFADLNVARPAAERGELETVAWANDIGDEAVMCGPDAVFYHPLVYQDTAELVIAGLRHELDILKSDFADCNAERERWNVRAEALETQLAAAEKVLEPLSEACTISTHPDDENIDDSIAATKIVFGDLRKARAVLRGNHAKPY